MERVNERQIGAWIFCAWLLPALMIFPQLGWMWATAGVLASAGLLMLLQYIKRKKMIRDHGAERLLKGALCLWNYIAMGQAMHWMTKIYPTAKNGALIAMVVLILAVYAAAKNRAEQTVAVTFFFQTVLIGVIYAFAIPQAEWVAPKWELREELLPYMLLPVTVVFLNGEERGKLPLGWLLGGGAVTVGAAFLTAGKSDTPFRFYEMIKSMSLFRTMERFESLVSASLTAAGFAYLTYLYKVNQSLRERNEKGSLYAEVWDLVLGIVGFVIAGRLTEGIIAVGTTICWGVIPLLLLLLGKSENIEKYEKSA